MENDDQRQYGLTEQEFAETRRVLLSRMRGHAAQERRTQSAPAWWHIAFVPGAGVLAAVILLVVSLSSEPGNVLYPLRVAWAEELGEYTHFTRNERLEYHTDVLEERISEVLEAAHERDDTDRTWDDIAWAIDEHTKEMTALASGADPSVAFIAHLARYDATLAAAQTQAWRTLHENGSLTASQQAVLALIEQADGHFSDITTEHAAFSRESHSADAIAHLLGTEAAAVLATVAQASDHANVSPAMRHNMEETLKEARLQFVAAARLAHAGKHEEAQRLYKDGLTGLIALELLLPTAQE